MDDPQLKAALSIIIDKMGTASGIAQELKIPITSAEKLEHSDHIIYLMIETSSEGNPIIVGLLKMGWKKLYLFDKKGSRSEDMVYCLLDFYIHETRQRHGYGITLLNYMLKDNQIQAKKLAIDQPTNKLLQFMWKHFHLSKLVNQGNNFVIYEEFFDSSNDTLSEVHSENRSCGYKNQPTFGRHGAARQQDCMAQILYGNKEAMYLDYVQNKKTSKPEEEEHKEIEPKIEQVHHENNHSNMDNNHQKLDIKNFHTQLW
ncbi:alpha-tubulin N-acetyltransferase 1-like isoform X2 [Daktulosphaira vitifoliae]|nr:alpha-tubulin N-acetyltransferase 1-like isoform X2 [Daktulosphaira vitifoliae]